MILFGRTKAISQHILEESVLWFLAGHIVMVPLNLTLSSLSARVHFFILFISRLLEEEFARRAELERLQEQQAKLLAATQQERDALHGDRLEQERLLRETAQRLEQLEADRAAADEQMKVPYRTY